jgi:hypothetical protein
MESENALQTLTLFFNDIIGAVIPGAMLIVGLLVIHIGPLSKEQFEFSSEIWFIALLTAFAAGHLLLSIHSKCLDEQLMRLGSFKFTRLLSITSTKRIRQEVEQSPAHLTFRSAAEDQILRRGRGSKISILSWGFNDVRNLAMSISSDASAVARRFMFISLLCYGAGAALIILAIDFSVASYFLPKAVAQYKNVPSPTIQLLLLLTTAWFFCARGSEFFRRALSTPFSIAYSALCLIENKEKDDGKG